MWLVHIWGEAACPCWQVDHKCLHTSFAGLVNSLSDVSDLTQYEDNMNDDVVLFQHLHVRSGDALSDHPASL